MYLLIASKCISWWGNWNDCPLRISLRTLKFIFENKYFVNICLTQSLGPPKKRFHPRPCRRSLRCSLSLFQRTFHARFEHVLQPREPCGNGNRNRTVNPSIRHFIISFPRQPSCAAVRTLLPQRVKRRKARKIEKSNSKSKSRACVLFLQLIFFPKVVLNNNRWPN